MTAVDPAKQLEEVRPLVEKELGATAPPALSLKIVDTPTLVQTIGDALSKRISDDRWAARSFMLSGMGVAQAGFDLRRAYAEALAQYQGTFYSSNLKVIYLAPGPNSLTNRFAIIRALGEAIDDYKYGLLQKRDSEENEDAYCAYTAIIDGSAANVITRIALNSEFSAVGDVQESSTSITSLSYHLSEPFVFRMLSLSLFGQWVLAHGSLDQVYAATDPDWKKSLFTGPYGRTRILLDLLGNDRAQPVNLTVPNLELLGNTGWLQADAGSLGAYDASTIIGILSGDIHTPDTVSPTFERAQNLFDDDNGTYSDPNLASLFFLGTSNAGAHLSADTYGIYRKGNDWLGLWLTTWDDSSEATAFRQLISQVQHAIVVQSGPAVIVAVTTAQSPPISADDLRRLLPQ
jgi:hypothetical protein